MIRTILASTALTAALIAGPALAADNTTTNATTSGQAMQAQTSAQGSQNVPQELKQKLASQGFSDVKVVPGSYIVSAKDKDGNPVTMIIGPNSMTVFALSSPDNMSSTDNTTTGSIKKHDTTGSTGASGDMSNSSNK